MDKDTKMSLIKDLLAGRLTKKQRRSYADLESVDRELKIQWNESENKAIDFKIKEQIWERVKARCVENVSIFIGLFYTIKKTGRIYSFIFYGSV